MSALPWEAPIYHSMLKHSRCAAKLRVERYIGASHGRASLITLVHEQGTLLHEEYLEDGVRIVAKLPARIAPRLERYRTE